jgi:hypothetical protein
MANNSKSFFSVIFFSGSEHYVERSHSKKFPRGNLKVIARQAPEQVFAFSIRRMIVCCEACGRTKPGGKRSGLYYIDGDVYNLAKIKKHCGSGRYLHQVRRLEGNKGRLVRCRTGVWQTFFPEDRIVRTK